MAFNGSRLNSRRFRHGASILPSILTTGNLFFGFWAIVRTLHEDYTGAALWIVVAGLLDVFDGRIARLTGTSSEFGGELDSLADAVSFGVAPGLLIYSWGMAALPRAGWLIAFIFVVCGVMRLARFNVQRHVVDGRYFVGLPIPAAAGLIAAVVLFMATPLSGRVPALIAGVLTLALALLMVSALRYTSFKKIDLKSRRSYIVVLGIACVFLLVAWRPTSFLLGLATSYSLSGPVMYLWSLLRRRGGAAPGAVAGGGISA